MSISVINNINSIIAENAVSNTQANLSNTLTQLSTGLRINSGADDAAGLAIAEGLGANVAALNQSSQNASNGIGLLQTADGALSQVTTQLNRAVTLATEASNGGLTTTQLSALNTEFTSILNEINQIGTTTNFNGTSVFSGNATNSLTSTQGSVGAPLSATTALTAGSITTITDSATGGIFKFTAAAGNTLATLQTAIAAAAGTTLSTGTALTFAAGKAVISNAVAGDSLTVSSTDATLGTFNATTSTGESAVVYTGDGTSGGATTLTTTINTLSATALNLNTLSLSSSANAQAALTAVTNAISTIAAQRGTIAASVNQLTADTNVQNTEVQNLTSAQNNIQNANIATVTANLSQYNILEQTGFDALSQSNQAQQNVLKLIQ